MKKLLSLVFGLAFCILSYAAGDAVRGGSTPDCILPQVARWIPANGGSFVLSKGAAYRLEGKGAADAAADAFRAYLESSPLAMQVADKKTAPAVKIQVGPKLLKDTREGAYQMTVDRKGVSIRANGVAGAF